MQSSPKGKVILSAENAENAENAEKRREAQS